MESIEREDLTHIEVEPIPKSGRLSLPSLGLRVSERRLMLFVVDVLLLCGSLILALLLTTDLIPNNEALFAAWKWYFTLIVVWLMFAALFDVYNLARAGSMMHGTRAAGMAALTTTAIYLTIPWLTPTLVNRSYGFTFVLLGVAGILLWRLVYARYFTQPTFQRRSLIVGTGAQGQLLALAMRNRFVAEEANPFLGTGNLPVGFVSGDEACPEAIVAGLPVLGQASELLRVVRELDVDDVILALPRHQALSSAVNEVVLDCRELGIPVKSMTAVYEDLTGRVPVDFGNRVVEAAASNEDSPFHRVYVLFKRATDVALALLGLLVVGILSLPIYLSNLLFSPGPLFYRQQRIGQGGKPFRIIKFRSMEVDAEKKNGATWAASDDDRVTPVGKWLRRLHLDEIPQVINILEGDMSLVGPRPERPEFVGVLAKEIPFYRARHSVRPGLSGWAQIHQDYGSSIEDAKVKLEYDLYYVKNFSFWLDVVIMLRTATKILGFKGR